MSMMIRVGSTGTTTITHLNYFLYHYYKVLCYAYYFSLFILLYVVGRYKILVTVIGVKLASYFYACTSILLSVYIKYFL